MRLYLLIGAPLYEGGKRRTLVSEVRELFAARYGWRTVGDLLRTARVR
jgi:hypothetical protein